jgi:nicotinate-nucleotide adenylyltransferase
MPAYVSPHKDKTVASATDRFEMVKLAVNTLPPTPPIIVSDWEIQRDAPTYTIDTIAEIKERYMPDEIYLILGSDSYATLQSWHRVEDLIDQVKLMVIDRKTVPVSATEIREKAMKSESIVGLVPDVIQAYIQHVGLYKRVLQV